MKQFITLIVGLCVTAAICAQAATAPAPRLMVQSKPGSTFATGGSVVFSPDGALLASTSNPQRSVQIWETRSGRLLCNLDRAVHGNSSLPGFGFPAIVFSRDSSLLATAADGGAVTLWDLHRCGDPVRVNLDPAQRKPVLALASLADGRALLLAGDGRLYLADLFRRQGKLEPLSADSSEASMLLAHTPDRRVVLEARLGLATGGGLLPAKAIFVRDQASGSAEPLSAYEETPSPADLFQAAALSPSGRWIAVHSGGQLTVYDRTARRVAARTALASGETVKQAGEALARTLPQETAQRAAEASLQKQRQRQLERLEEKIKGLSPEQQVQLRAQVEQALAQAAQQVEQRAAEPVAIPAYADSLLRGAQWVGFSADEEQVYVWKNTARPQLESLSAAKNPLAFEVRRRSDLALLATHSFEQTNAGGLLVGASFAQSEDRTLLAVQSVGVGGAGMAIVDLARQSIRAWSPNNGLPAALAWNGTDRLVTVHALQSSGAESAVLARGAQTPVANEDDGSTRGTQNGLATRFVRWDLTSGDIAERSTNDSMIHSQACVAAGGNFFARTTQQINAGSLPHVVVYVDETSTMSRAWRGPVHDAAGRLVHEAPIACAVSADGQRVLVAAPGPATPAAAGERRRAGGLRLLVVETGSGRTVAQHELPFAARRRLSSRSLAFAPDGRHIVIPAERELYVLALDAAVSQAPRRYAFDGDFYGVLNAEPLQIIASAAGRNNSRRAERRRAAEAAKSSADVETEQPAIVALPRIAGEQRIAVSDANGLWVAASGADNRIELHRFENGALDTAPMFLAAHSARVTTMAFSPDARWLASASDDGSIVLWNVADGKWLVKLFTFPDGTWAVVDAQGRFDTNNLEQIEQLHWVMPDDPLRALPLEVFMRDYYEPRLLSRLLAGEAFAPVRDLSELNRAQPEVRISGIEADTTNPNRVTVTVEAKPSKDTHGQSSEVHGVRLFRDGQLVGINPADDGAVALDANGLARIRFENIALPASSQPIQFSAYAFNRDRVKSATVRARFERSVASQGAAARAYVIAIGVNEHDSPVWRLDFAANDARRMSEILQRRLGATRRYGEVVAVTLVSETAGARDATKAKIAAVLSVLAGKPPSALLHGVAGAGKLKAAKPDDLVLISFSGHGLAGSAGAFYLLPSDTGASSERGLHDDLRRRAISTDDLALWLREVDAGDIMMIVDACYSAATVDSEGFKPGPMGARGLGQLAYDKGIRLLAASQADDVAREIGRLRHGLLTYALVSDGIEGGRADFRPKDKRIEAAEWLNYGVERVPQLHLQSKGVDIAEPQRGGTRAVRMVRAAQQPKLFDFARTRRQPLIAAFD